MFLLQFLIESSDTNGGIDLHVLDTQENRDSVFDEKPVDNRRDFFKIHVSFNQYDAESPLKSGPNQGSLEVPNTRWSTQKQAFSTGKHFRIRSQQKSEILQNQYFGS